MSCDAAFNTHKEGELVRVYGNFTLHGTTTLVDPDTVSLSVRDPSGNVTTYVYGTDAGMVKLETGKYEFHIDVDEPGTWYYRWHTSGDYQGAIELFFEVEPALAQ